MRFKEDFEREWETWFQAKGSVVWVRNWNKGPGGCRRVGVEWGLVYKHSTWQGTRKAGLVFSTSAASCRIRWEVLRKHVGRLIENNTKTKQEDWGSKWQPWLAFLLFLINYDSVFPPFSLHTSPPTELNTKYEYGKYEMNIRSLYLCYSPSYYNSLFFNPELFRNIPLIIRGFDPSVWSVPHVLSK